MKQQTASQIHRWNTMQHLNSLIDYLTHQARPLSYDAMNVQWEIVTAAMLRVARAWDKDR